jgi:predicted signal transduction protein with EAL and GGDEF domain/DNA-binding response OmpR family regulator
LLSTTHRQNHLLTLLVVDDDDLLRLVASEALRKEGYRVMEAASGPQALELLSRQTVDLLVLDLLMPEMDGFAVCSEIRAGRHGQELLPIMIMTALDDNGSIARAFEVGATDFITKPLSTTILTQRVRYMLRTHQALQTFEDRERRLENAERIARLGSWEWDPSIGELQVSREYLRIIGHGEYSELDFQTVVGLAPVQERDLLRRQFEDVIDARAPRWVAEHSIVTPDGQRKRVRQEAEISYRGERGYSLAGTMQDISEETALKDQMLKLAYYDGLTQLPNRVFFKSHLDYALKQARLKGHTLAVIVMDLDLFTRVNSSLGPDAGDMVLMQMSHRLHEALGSPQCTQLISAAVDPNAVQEPMHDVLARLDGDKFVILRYQFGTLDDLVTLLNKTMRRLASPFHIKGSDVVLTVSVGVAFYPVNGQNGETLMRNADAALRVAKQQGRNQFLFYTGEIDSRSRERLLLEAELRAAIANRDFELHYQPKVDLRTHDVASVEALIRWRHKEKGLISPALFIPVAEELGLINDMGAWLIDEACRQTKAWNQEGMPPIRTAINISALQLRQSNFLDQISDALTRHRLLPTQLEVEITEGILMEDTQRTMRMLEGLRSLGVKVALDDFGTGYSSLSYLTRFPFTALKIDRSFIRDCNRNGQSAAIVQTIIQLCKNLNMEVVAEGVETIQELRLLMDRRCDVIQGFFFSKPLEASTLTEYVRQKFWTVPLAEIG